MLPFNDVFYADPDRNSAPVLPYGEWREQALRGFVFRCPESYLQDIWQTGTTPQYAYETALANGLLGVAKVRKPVGRPRLSFGLEQVKRRFAAALLREGERLTGRAFITIEAREYALKIIELAKKQLDESGV